MPLDETKVAAAVENLVHIYSDFTDKMIEWSKNWDSAFAVLEKMENELDALLAMVDPVPTPTPDPVPDPIPDPVPDPVPDPDPAPVPVPDPTSRNVIGCGITRDAASGKTIFANTGGTVFVAHSGSDSQDGTRSQPVATVQKAIQLARSRGELNICILEGPVWCNGRLDYAGKGPLAPLLIHADPSVKYPQLLGVTYDRPLANAALAFVGLTLAKPLIRAQGGWLSIEDCSIIGGAEVQTSRVSDGTMGPPSNWWQEFSLRLCRVLDNYAPGNYAQGLFTFGVDKQLLEGNLFDHNGWGPGDRASAQPASFFERSRSHNAYLQSPYGDAIVRRNIFARGASHGIQMRYGGECSQNLFLENPIGLQFGYYEGNKPYQPCTGIVFMNTFLGSDVITNDSPRGVGIWLANCADVSLYGNTFAFYSGSTVNSACVYLDAGRPIHVSQTRENTYRRWDGRTVIRRGEIDVTGEAVVESLRDLGDRDAGGLVALDELRGADLRRARGVGFGSIKDVTSLIDKGWSAALGQID